jgi:N-acylglucosamine 2-epimerase
MMKKEFFEKYYEKTYDILMNDFVSFWTKVSVDEIYGGYLCGFDREGNLFYEDKSVWQQGRSLWMFSKLYNEFGKETKWLDAARSGYDFINRYCFAKNNHMYFRVTRDGKPLVERRYYFSEAFAIMGFTEYYKATGDINVKKRAIWLYDLFLKYYNTSVDDLRAWTRVDADAYKNNIYSVLKDEFGVELNTNNNG